MTPTDDLDFGQTIRGFAEGQKVFGRYTLRKILGRGGMGIVWLAWDEKLEEEIALKFMPEMVRLDEAGIRELKRETRKSLKLTHAHIVRIRDFVEDAQSAAIAMEYVDGPTFSGLRFEQAGDVFSPEQLIVYLQQLVSALTYAHEVASVVHRDLKPANLMVNSLGHLKVADFGISGSVSDSMSRMSMQTGSSGSPPYMSPQQVMGEPTKPTDDIYSVGATIYELLTSKPPFYRGNIHAQIRETVPPLMSERRVELGIEVESGIPPLWDAVVARCLAKNPAERPQSAQQLLDWLEEREEIPALGGEEPPPQIPESPAVIEERPDKLRNSRHLIVVGAVVGILLLGIAVAGTWWFKYEGPRREQERIIAQQAKEAEVTRLAEERKIAEEKKLAEQRKIEAAQIAELARKAAIEKEATRLSYRKMDQAQLEHLADEGDPEAQFIWGYRFVYGDPTHGVPFNVEAARPWLEKAIAQGHPLAAIELATILAYEAEDKNRAIKLVKDYLPATRVLADAGDAISQLYLGFLYERDLGVAKDLNEATKWYRLAAEQGLGPAQDALGRSYWNGEGVAKDEKEAIKWYRLAAAQGDSSAQCSLGHAFSKGIGVEKDEEEAIRWYRLSADQGNAYSQNSLGFMYHFGRGVAKAKEAAVRWHRLAADQGDASGQNNLGYLYENGEGVAKDEKEAAKWYRLAADQGNAFAQKNLGFMYYKGRGVEKDDREAMKWFRLAADQGDATAQSWVGALYRDGEGVEKNKSEAIKWYRLSADQGNAIAQVWVGCLYKDGEGVKQDYGEAVKWFRLAADQGDAQAQTLLGNMYYKGRGLAKDDREAIKWYRLAAAQGDENAKKSLNNLGGE